MSLEDLGNIGEFVAAVGVIISLIYLAVQIRQNTSSVRTSTFQSSASRASDFTRAVAEEKELAHILRTGLLEPEQLDDDDDRFRFAMLLSTMFRQYEDLFFQYRAGTLTSESWDAWRHSIRSSISNPGFSLFWGIRRLSFTGSFRQFIEAECEATDPQSTLANAIERMKRAAQHPAEPSREQATEG